MNSEAKKILVIDDEIHLLLAFQTFLQRKGYDVITCSDSTAGIKAAKDKRPNLIVCDIMMPIKNGFEVKAQLSLDPATCNIPFVFLSARTGQADKLHGLESGADDYITKPFDSKELVARIEAVLRRQEKDWNDAKLEMEGEIEHIWQEISQNISHELRTPMTQIMMSLDLILRQKYNDPNELKWFLETALAQSVHLNALIDDLIFLNNHDTGHLTTFLRQNVNLDVHFKDPIHKHLDLYRDKNLHLKFNISPDVTLHAPCREFKQAVIHLVDNAMKFSPTKSPIHVKLEPNEAGGCILTISDTGIGIPSDLHEKVFERFYQVSQGITRQYGGLGVGLTISRMITRSLGGDVVILPSERGCKVRLTLPPAPLDIP